MIKVKDSRIILQNNYSRFVMILHAVSLAKPIKMVEINSKMLDW